MPQLAWETKIMKLQTNSLFWPHKTPHFLSGDTNLFWTSRGSLHDYFSAAASFDMFTCILQAPKLANLTNAADPAVHLLLGFGHQVENTRWGFYHEEVLSVKVPLYPQLPFQHFHHALFQVNGADWLFGVIALIVFQHIWITAHATSSKHKPTFPPCLQVQEVKKV